MKRYLGFSVVALVCAFIFGSVSGCTTQGNPESAATATITSSRSAENRSSPTPRPRTRAKGSVSTVPIVVTKAAATPTPSAKSKRTVRARPKDGVPTGTSIPFYFSVDSGAWPASIDFVSTVAKCYEITTLSNGSTPSVGLNSTQLPVFPTGATSKSLVLTDGATPQVNLTFPSSTAGMDLMVIITGTAEDEDGNIYNFSGAENVVVNP